MLTNYFQVPYFVIPLNDHLEIKDSLLHLLNKAEFDSVDEISKTDFYLKKDQEYKKFIIPILLKEIKKLFVDDKIKILDCWFQEYSKYSYHPYHSHSCEWALIYYINLPTGSKGTMFKNFFSDLEIKPELKEGDIIIFPGWIMHKAPPNFSSSVRTIISMNFEKTY